MSQPKFLIDTNIFIGLEGQQEVDPEYSQFSILAAKHNLGVFIHQAAKDDIARDKDKTRRDISLSKIEKFQTIAKVSGLSQAILESAFGPLAKENDVVDATLLHALQIGVVDFVVTEDRGLHDRARKYSPDLMDAVLFIRDAVARLQSAYEPVEVPIRYVEEVDAHTIPLSDPIFESLREGYPEFDTWWKEKCVRLLRKCWVVVDGGVRAGIVVRKDETSADTDATIRGDKILKICTFKVRQESRGIKLGELLLKQILWYAHANKYDVVYLTTYPQQNLLIELLEFYGFSQTHINDDGELTYEKNMKPDQTEAFERKPLFEKARLAYPNLYLQENVECFGIPIQEDYHDVLFPELRNPIQTDLFDSMAGPKRAGNTIRKVYLCRAPIKIIAPGSLILFYKGKSKNTPSQSITTVAVFEDMKLAQSTTDLMRMAGGRSVYSKRSLEQWNATPEQPVKVLNFLLAGYITPPLSLDDLKARGVLKGTPQSICKILNSHLGFLLQGLRYGQQ